MIERLQARRNSEDGFTLVELLVVIVILGVLASIVVFAVGGISDKGNSAASATDKSVLQSAEEAAYAQANSSVYQSEADLKLNKFLRTDSSTWDICLAKAAVGPPVVAAKSDYQIVAQGVACPAGWSATGS